jgi:hypothetical protein
MSKKCFSFCVFALTGISLFAQSPTMPELEQKFNSAYCSCLEGYSLGLKPGQLLYNQSEACIRGFFRDHNAEFEAFILHDSALMASDLTPYEKGRKVGSRLIQNSIDELVNDCSFYRQTLSEFKSIMISQVLKPQDSIEMVIDRLKTNEAQFTDPKSRATFYTLMGVAYEYAGRKKEALIWYDKSLETEVTTSAKGLKALLQTEK